MIRHLKVFLVFLVLNTMVASIYLVWGIIRSSEKGQWKNYLFKAEVMLFCPGVGPMFFFVSNLIYKIFFRKAVDLADVIFSKERVTTFKRADIEAEGNLVPIEEALVVSDKGSQRALLLKVARGDIHNSLASISLALNSDDSETAHYAAAVLQDALNDFRLKVQELYEHMKEDEEDAPEYAALMIEYMNNMLSQSVFDELEQEKYIGMMEEAGEVLYQKAKEKLTAIYIECICLRLLQAMKYDRMEVWCRRSRELHPDVLSTYTLQLKLYFTIQDKQKFFEVLNALKQSDIVIDRDTLALIRAFYESGSEKETAAAEAENNSEDKMAAIATTEEKAESISAERTENTEKAVLEDMSEKADSTNAKAQQNVSKEIKLEEIDVPQSVSKETKSEKAKALQSIFEEIEQEEAAAEQKLSKKEKSEEAKVLQSIFEEIEQEEAKAQSASKEIKPEEAAIPQTISKESEFKATKPEEAVIPQDMSKESEFKAAKPEEAAIPQDMSKESEFKAAKPEEAAIPQDMSKESEFKAAKPEEATISQGISEETASAEETIQQKESEEAGLTKTMVSDVIGDLMAESAATEDINKQINQIIDELIIESENREKEAAALNQTRLAHDRQISDKKKIDVLKTIAKKHKIWTCLGLGFTIACVCLFIYVKNRKNKEE